MIIDDSKIYLDKLKNVIGEILKSNNCETIVEPSIEELNKHIFNFIVFIAGSHCGIVEQEKEFISRTFQTSKIEEIIPKNVREIIEHRETLFNNTPMYLKNINSLCGRDEVINVVECIMNLGINFAAIDYNFSQNEAKALAEYKQILLKKFLMFYNENQDLRMISEKGKKIENQKNITQVLNNQKRDLSDVLAEFDELVGLENVKQELHTLINLAQINKIRKARNLPVVQISNHLVFSGNPGTGKTTVARLLSEIYGIIGVLSKGQLIEVDRTALVGEYIGQTSQKTKAVINTAMGGILFIDEAYALSDGGKEDYGKEAIAVLLKEMEDNREDLVVIVAGYTDEMENFININPGLKSRFNKYIKFEDFTGEQLFEILQRMLKKNQYVMTGQLEYLIRNYLENVNKSKFGNARGVRNLFEKLLAAQANRIVNIKNISLEELKMLTVEDFERVA